MTGVSGMLCLHPLKERDEKVKEKGKNGKSVSLGKE